jgi:predicted alpha-1,2-mannosidase
MWDAAWRASLLTLLATGAALTCAGCGESSAAPASAHDPPPVSISPGSGPVALVDPLIGTADSDSPDPVPGGSGGSTFPGAAVPFGRVQWSPDTPNASPAGYRYDDSEIIGFAATHLSGAGCAGERDFPFFPSLNRPDPDKGPSDGFLHSDEIASPGFYQVKLASGIQVDLTATARTGLARFTFPGARGGYVTIASGEQNDVLTTRDFDAEVAGPSLVTGHRNTGFFCGSSTSYTLYFAARFERSFDSVGSYKDRELVPGSKQATGSQSGLYVHFPGPAHSVQVKLGLSYVSVDGALASLDAENPDWDFDAVHARAIDAWNDWLGRIAVEGGGADAQKMFYTALYHVLVEPVVLDDVDGSTIGFDDQVRLSSDFVHYATFSGWDIYRSWIQLVAAIGAGEASDMVRSLLDASSECGALPRWSLVNHDTGEMVGDPADPIIAGAYAFGARGFDAKQALSAMLVGADDPSSSCTGYPSRPNLADYLERHYLPVDGTQYVWGPPSTTLEYAIADFSIAKLATAVGDTTTAQRFFDRGRWWQNVFNPAYAANGFQGYMQPRYRDDVAGKPAFQSISIVDKDAFVEGNAAQYTFMVPQDLAGLATALGGDASMIQRLDDLLSQLNAGLTSPHFYIGNEPEFATPWEYPAVGAPYKTAEAVRRIVTQEFSTGPGGLPGNDDLGATSSWLVWAMLGLYPVVPGSSELVIGSPLFDKVTITLESGKVISIEAQGAGIDAPYVQSSSVNGAPTQKSWLDWDAISQGATLSFVLGTEPNTSFGAAPNDRPPPEYP